MSCITKLLEMKGDKPFMLISADVVIEGGGTYKDHEYMIVFTESGYRCGYVAVKDESKLTVSEDWGYPDIRCHGGVTFYSSEHFSKDLLSVPCNDKWIGFDAAHAWDKQCMETSEKYFGETDSIKSRKENPWPQFYEHVWHRSYEYMEKECHDIIDQLLELN